MSQSKVIDIRNLQPEVHAVLVQRAKQRGVSLSAYLRDVLIKHAQTATLDEVLDALPPPNVKITAQEIVDGIHAERESRRS